MNGIMDQWWKVGGALGIVFIVLFIIGGVIQGDGPMYNDDLDDIRAYWNDSGDDYLLGDYIIGVAVIFFFLPFASALRALLGVAEGGPQLCARLSFAGAVLFLAFAATAGAAWGTLAFAGENLSDDTVVALMYLDVYAWSIIPMALALLIGAASIVIFRTGVLWKWLAVVGLIVTIAAVLTPLGVLDDDPEDVFDTIGFVGFIGAAIWVLLISIGMIMKPVLVATGPRDADTASIEAAQPPRP